MINAPPQPVVDEALALTDRAILKMGVVDAPEQKNPQHGE
jgi:hypothetical protein